MGTLYIGESGWLNERLNQLRRSLKQEETHGAGSMWRESRVLGSKFPLSNLGIAMLGTSVRMHEFIERDSHPGVFQFVRRYAAAELQLLAARRRDLLGG